MVAPSARACSRRCSKRNARPCTSNGASLPAVRARAGRAVMGAQRMLTRVRTAPGCLAHDRRRRAPGRCGLCAQRGLCSAPDSARRHLPAEPEQDRHAGQIPGRAAEVVPTSFWLSHAARGRGHEPSGLTSGGREPLAAGVPRPSLAAATRFVPCPVRADEIISETNGPARCDARPRWPSSAEPPSLRLPHV